MSSAAKHYILTASCPSALGTVDAVTRTLVEHDCYIDDMASFDDTSNDMFFIRIQFRCTADENCLQGFRAAMADKANNFDMNWEIHNSEERIKVTIMVSKYDHCLNDLLYRWRTNQLKVDVKGVVSNHPDLEQLAYWHNLPYYHLPVNKENKREQEQALLEIMKADGSELLILARYMQILTEDMCKDVHGKAINIHHSLLPGFKGARPYQRAFEHGVKLVGATAHYVTGDLDEGPIITQQVATVDHGHSTEDLTTKGKDTESQTLAEAVRLHSEHRVFINGKRTIILR